VILVDEEGEKVRYIIYFCKTWRSYI